MNKKSEESLKISSNIKKLRTKLGWNQARLAQEAGISGAALSKIESDEGRNPTIIVLKKLAHALKVETSDITGESLVNKSQNDLKVNEFYRKFGIMSELTEEDQNRLIDMAERLKAITPK